MLQLNDCEKKNFLLFVTGSTRLPIGGELFLILSLNLLNIKIFQYLFIYFFKK